MANRQKTLDAAKIIMNGEPYIATARGLKRLEGVAEIIAEANDAALRKAARKVVSRWASGDLAAAVRELDMLVNS